MNLLLKLNKDMIDDNNTRIRYKVSLNICDLPKNNNFLKRLLVKHFIHNRYTIV